MGHETTRRCRFSTDRLVVDEWHRLADRYGLSLVAVVMEVLTDATTAALPLDWRGDFDRRRAERWIEARDAGSPTQLVVERRTGAAVGLMILFETTFGRADESIDVRLGYVLAESCWGKGLAGELVGGLVGWAAGQPAVRSISGGVAPHNAGSTRVLLKNGFSPIDEGGDEQIYRLDLP